MALVESAEIAELESDGKGRMHMLLTLSAVSLNCFVQCNRHAQLREGTAEVLVTSHAASRCVTSTKAIG